MPVIKFNSLLSEMQPRMENVEVITGGYLTEEKIITDQTLELFASSAGPDKVEFYVNQNNQLFSVHYARMLDLRYAVCAIDFFPDCGQADINTIATRLEAEIKRKA